MEGRRVNHSAPKRNPLYVMFLCLVAAVFVLLIVVIVLGAKLGADLAGGEEERDTLARDGADVAARQRALEGIGDHDALFHALCLPCGCFSYSICKPRAGCKSFPPQR